VEEEGREGGRGGGREEGREGGLFRRARRSSHVWKCVGEEQRRLGKEGGKEGGREGGRAVGEKLPSKEEGGREAGKEGRTLVAVLDERVNLNNHRHSLFS